MLTEFPSVVWAFFSLLTGQSRAFEVEGCFYQRGYRASREDGLMSSPSNALNSDAQKDSTSSTTTAAAVVKDAGASTQHPPPPPPPQQQQGCDSDRPPLQQQATSSTETTATTQNHPHQDATFARLPSPGIEPGTDPLYLLDQTLQQLVGLLGVLSRERQTLILQRRELQEEWKKFHTAKATAPGLPPAAAIPTGTSLGTVGGLQRMNSMVAHANARALQAVRESYAADPSDATTRKRPAAAAGPSMPLGWSKRSRTESSRPERPVDSTEDPIPSALPGYFKLRNGEPPTARVKWPYREEEADREVQLLSGFPQDEIVEVLLNDPSRRRSPGRRSRHRGVSWVAQSQSWIARWMEEGKLRTKSFSSRKYGYEKALEMAEKYRRSMELKRLHGVDSDAKSEVPSPEASEAPHSSESDGRHSGDRPGENSVNPSKAMIEVGRNEGVYYNKSSRTWYIRVSDTGGRVRTKGFSIPRLGLHDAFEAAVKFRRQLDGSMNGVKAEISTIAEGTPTSTQVSSPGVCREGREHRGERSPEEEAAAAVRAAAGEYDYSLL
ncbi:hypothetical protein FOZ63_011726 [Perkinsus olseni]|uniref:AP2/ERF domain-containing protein n=1 Tax=Perkinsus olseni TaxID=32597 RepID=A0A7J6QE72_PEROL|nr:hypothetical protein FOZ63_011726 [Perkinsus olseni]